MAKLKKTNVTLQTEVKNDDEWNEIVHREGLILVDVYCRWSGPCTAMLSTLKKIKMESGGDLLTCVLACNDEITSLERFRGKSEPIWMFIQNGKMINLFFGSHCPNFKKVLIKEIKRVQNNEPPDYQLSIEQRTPDEEVRFIKAETLRTMRELEERTKREAAEKAAYEGFMEQMMIELCEENALIIFPWAFIDDYGHVIDKEMSQPYLELVSKILPNRFDIIEQIKIQLDDNMILNIFKESGIILTIDLIDCLTDGECIVMRLKGRLPPSDWPVPYPHVSHEGGKKCPTRALNDIENFLKFILEDIPPSSNADIIHQSFMERYKSYVDDSEEEEDEEEITEYPVVWFPTNARNKVHVFKTLFPTYMDKAHPYQEPTKPLPMIAIKFDLSKLNTLAEYYKLYREAIEYFGVFEFDDSRARRLASSPEIYYNKIKRRTGLEIILIIFRKLNDNVFFAFAGSDPIFIEENLIGIVDIIQQFFPEGAVDFEPDAYLQDDEEEEEDTENYYEIYNDEGAFH